MSTTTTTSFSAPAPAVSAPFVFPNKLGSGVPQLVGSPIPSVQNGALVTASSEYSVGLVERSLLDYYYGSGIGGWLAQTAKADEWIQVTEPVPRIWVGLSVQSRYDADQRPSAFTVSYSSDGTNWTPVDNGKEFVGPVDRYHVQGVFFETAFVATAVRLTIKKWVGHPGLRWEVYYAAGVGQDPASFPPAIPFRPPTPPHEGGVAFLQTNINKRKALTLDDGKVGVSADDPQSWSSLNVTFKQTYIPHPILEATFASTKFPNLFLSVAANGVLEVASNPASASVVTWEVKDYGDGNYNFTHTATRKVLAFNGGFLVSNNYTRDGWEAFRIVAAPTPSTVYRAEGYEPVPAIKTGAVVVASSLSGAANPDDYVQLDNEDGVGAWLPRTVDQDQWIQVQSARRRRWIGITLQARHNVEHKILTFTLSYSDDGLEWKPVDGGKVFTGVSLLRKKYGHFFTTPFQATYVRLVPVTWLNSIALRFDVFYAEDNSRQPLPNLLPPPGPFFLQSNYVSRFAVGIKSDGAVQNPEWPSKWTLLSQARKVEYVPHQKITVLISSVQNPELYLSIKDNGTAGTTTDRSENGPAAFLLEEAYDAEGIFFFTHIATGKTLASNGSSTYSTTAYGKTGVEAFRFVDAPYEADAVGYEPVPAIRNGAKVITSTVYNAEAEQNLLWGEQGTAAWLVSQNTVGQWTQIVAEVPRKWVGVTVQGRKDTAQRVQSFQVLYSDDGQQWKAADNGRVFFGPSHHSEVVGHFFKTPFVSIYLRIKVLTWNEHISLRWEAYYQSEDPAHKEPLPNRFPPSGALYLQSQYVTRYAIGINEADATVISRENPALWKALEPKVKITYKPYQSISATFASASNNKLFLTVAADGRVVTTNNEAEAKFAIREAGDAHDGVFYLTHEATAKVLVSDGSRAYTAVDSYNKALAFRFVSVPQPFPFASDVPSITLCENPSYTGRKITLTGPIPEFKPLAFDDITSSIIVNNGEWELYKDPNYGGPQWKLAPGKYPTATGLWGDDQISSAKPVGAQTANVPSITFYENDIGSGRAISLSGPTPNFSYLGFNDIASSAVVTAGTWEIFSDPNFLGTSTTLKPGSYPTATVPWKNDTTSSARPVGDNGSPAPTQKGPVGAIQNGAKVSSSTIYGVNGEADKCVLDNQGGYGAWLASTLNDVQWIQLEERVSRRWVGVAVQCRYNVQDQRVISFTLSYSDDGKLWRFADGGKTFPGATGDLISYYGFEKEFQAKFVRLNVVTWNSHISLRWDAFYARGPAPPPPTRPGTPVEGTYFVVSNKFDTNAVDVNNGIASAKAGPEGWHQSLLKVYPGGILTLSQGQHFLTVTPSGTVGTTTDGDPNGPAGWDFELAAEGVYFLVHRDTKKVLAFVDGKLTTTNNRQKDGAEGWKFVVPPFVVTNPDGSRTAHNGDGTKTELPKDGGVFFLQHNKQSRLALITKDSGVVSSQDGPKGWLAWKLAFKVTYNPAATYTVYFSRGKKFLTISADGKVETTEDGKDEGPAAFLLEYANPTVGFLTHKATGLVLALNDSGAPATSKNKVADGLEGWRFISAPYVVEKPEGKFTYGPDGEVTEPPPVTTVEEIEKNIEEKGGNASGKLAFSISWSTKDDLDLNVLTPHGERIWWRTKTSTSGGVLDVDARGIDNPVENVTWGDHEPEKGTYSVSVTYYDGPNKAGGPLPFTALISLPSGEKKLENHSITYTNGVDQKLIGQFTI